MVQWNTYVDIIATTGTPLFLMSAFDYAQAPSTVQGEVRTSLAKARSLGSRIVLDSGGYEASWLRQSWTHEAYSMVAAEIQPDILFTFDDPGHIPGDSYLQALGELTRDAEVAQGATLVPIVHGIPEQLAEASNRLAMLDPPMIAVAERRLGQGIEERRRNVAAIRAAMDESGLDIPLHLLGTGDPRSIVAFSFAGADSFDAVDWSQFAVDPATAELLPAARLDWLQGRSSAEPSESYTIELLLRNLHFYETWMERIRQDMTNGTVTMVEEWLPADVHRQLTGNSGS
jgi:queuine/archaeosine tRNA-ribosyltransferase